MHGGLKMLWTVPELEGCNGDAFASVKQSINQIASHSSSKHVPWLRALLVSPVYSCILWVPQLAGVGKEHLQTVALVVPSSRPHPGPYIFAEAIEAPAFAYVNSSSLSRCILLP